MFFFFFLILSTPSRPSMFDFLWWCWKKNCKRNLKQQKHVCEMFYQFFLWNLKLFFLSQFHEWLKTKLVILKNILIFSLIWKTTQSSSHYQQNLMMWCLKLLLNVANGQSLPKPVAKGSTRLSKKNENV